MGSAESKYGIEPRGKKGGSKRKRDKNKNNITDFLNKNYLSNQQQQFSKRRKSHKKFLNPSSSDKITAILNQGALNHPQKEWASKEDMLSFTQTKVTDESGKDVEIDLNSCFEHNLRLGSNKVKALNQKQVIPLLVNMKETNFDASDIEIDTKIDLVCVIDISGSMAGNKIDYVRKTMLNLLEVLQGHRLAIILFDGSAELYMNFKVINPENYPSIKRGIENIKDRGSTNITEGVHTAQYLLGLRETKNSVSAIFVLSDGEHNCGPISQSLLFDNDTERTKCEYTLTSFGYGDGHDAKLLQMMSEHKGGNYYFVNDITKVEDCFLDCLGMVTSILGQNIKAKIKLISTHIWPEIRFNKTFGSYWNDISAIEKEIKINSFFAGFNKNFIAQIELDPVTPNKVTEETEILIAQCHIEIDTLGIGSKTVHFHSDLKIKVLPSGSTEIIEEVVEVQKQYTRVKGAEVIEMADKLEEERNFKEAEKIIKEFQTSIGKYQDDELFVQMNDAMSKQCEMISNKQKGIKNEFKTRNFAMQQKNCYMNEASAPMFNKSLYQNRKQKKMSKY